MVSRLQKIILSFVAFTVLGVFTLAYFVVFRNEPYTEPSPSVIADFRPTGAKTIPLVELSGDTLANIPVYDYSPSAVLPVSPSSVADGSSTYGYNWLSKNTAGTERDRLLGVYNAVKSMTITANSTTAGNYGIIDAAEAEQAIDLKTSYYSVGQVTLQSAGINLTLTEMAEIAANMNTDAMKDVSVIKLLQLAVNTFSQDNPQYISSMVNFSVTYEYIEFLGKKIPITETVAVIPLYPAQYRLYADRAAAYAKVENKFAEYEALAYTVNTPAERIRLVHDKILTERDYAYINYGSGYVPSLEVVAHNIMGVMAPEDFSPQYNPVCESYAKANAYILSRLGIECFTVFGDTSGGYHAWNIIKIDGYWYWHDVTWDDNESTNPGRPNYDVNNTKNSFSASYFLRGAAGWANHTPNATDGVNTTSLGVGIPSPISPSNYSMPTTYNWSIPQSVNLGTVYAGQPSSFVPNVTISGLTQGADFTVVQLGTPAYGSPSRFLVYGIGGNRGVGLVMATLTAPQTPAQPTGLYAVYGQSLEAVSLPNGWHWVAPFDTVGNAGTRTHYANFYGVDGYATLYNVPLSVTVIKATPAPTVPADITATFLQTLSEIKLPAGWSWKTPANTVGSIGQRTHAAVFTPADTDNYNTVDANIYITVSPATPNVSAPAGITAVYGQTLGEIELPAGWGWKTPTDPVGEVGEQTHAAIFDMRNENFYTVRKDILLTVTEPADPNEPSEPSEPTEPADPSEPSEPTEPNEPGEPTEPADPNEPSEPSEPADPSEPSEPVEPSEPTEPGGSTEPSEPNEPNEPTENQPSEPAEPSEPDEPADTELQPSPKNIDAEDIALAATGVFCLGLIYLTARKFLFKG